MSDFKTVTVPKTNAQIKEAVSLLTVEAEAMLSTGATGPVADQARRTLILCAIVAALNEKLETASKPKAASAPRPKVTPPPEQAKISTQQA